MLRPHSRTRRREDPAVGQFRGSGEAPCSAGSLPRTHTCPSPQQHPAGAKPPGVVSGHLCVPDAPDAREPATAAASRE